MKLLNSNQQNTSLCCFPKCSLKSEVKTNEISRDTLVIHFFGSSLHWTPQIYPKEKEWRRQLSSVRWTYLNLQFCIQLNFHASGVQFFWQTVAQTFSRTETTIELSNAIVVFFHYLQLKNIHTLIKINHVRQWGLYI